MRLRLAEPRFGAEELEAIGRVLSSGQLTQGPVVAEFERSIAELCGVRHAVATTSATTALELVLAALDIGRGDEVLVADFSYPASGNAVLARGGDVRLLDVDPSTYCVDPSAVEAALTDRTKAVIAVDVFGLPADYTVLEPLLARLGVPLVCDAACSLGGAIGDRRAGSFGVAGCFSFHPRKSLTTGEGGMVTTDDASLADRMRRLRNHGGEREGWRTTFVEAGFNFRMSDLNAALGLAQVPGHLETVHLRGQLAERLARRVDEIEGISPQAVPNGFTHPYQAFVVTSDESLDRDRLIAGLLDRGVESTLGTYAMHAEPSFRVVCGTTPGELESSYGLAQRTLALPLHQGLTPTDMDAVADALAEVIEQQ